MRIFTLSIRRSFLYIAQTAVHAAQMAKDGKSVDEIITECEKYIKHGDVTFG